MWHQLFQGIQWTPKYILHFKGYKWILLSLYRFANRFRNWMSKDAFERKVKLFRTLIIGSSKLRDWLFISPPEDNILFRYLPQYTTNLLRKDRNHWSMCWEGWQSLSRNWLITESISYSLLRHQLWKFPSFHYRQEQSIKNLY